MKKDNQIYQQKKNSIKENTLIKKKNGSSFFILIAFCLPVLLYMQTINFGFTNLDDNTIISKNIDFLRDFRNAPKAFLTDAYIAKPISFSYYRPLQTLSFMIDIKLSGGNNTWMYHLSNILLLGAISCFLFLLLKRFLIPEKLALISSLIYCSHPLFVSTVALIPTRGELLLTLFSLLSFLFFIEFLQKKKKIYLFFHWLAFTIALFCKETAVLLPLLFIIYFFTFHFEKRFEKKYLIIIITYIVSEIGWFWLHFKAIGGISNPTNGVYGLPAILLNIQTIPESISKFFLPFNNAPFPGFSFFKTLTGLVIIGIIIFMFFKNNERSKKEKIFCISWFLFLMFPPMLYKHPAIEYLDHRFFFPLIGILLFILFIFPKKWMAKGHIKNYWLLIVVLVFLCPSTFINSRSYSDPMTFYNSSISKNPNSAMAYFGRGEIKNAKGDFKNAIDDYNKAINICPKFDQSFCNRGFAELSIGENRLALADFNIAISLDNENVNAYYYKGLTDLRFGNYNDAIINFNKIISINPNHSEIYNSKGVALYSIGNYQEAIFNYNKALSLDSNYTEAYINKGVAMYLSGNIPEALINFNKAIKINPNNPDTYYNRAIAKDTLKDFAGAIEDFENVLKLNPNNQKALQLKYRAQQELKK